MYFVVPENTKSNKYGVANKPPCGCNPRRSGNRTCWIMFVIQSKGQFGTL